MRPWLCYLGIWGRQHSAQSQNALCQLGNIACRAFHISEDVFAGYNATLRGARTVFREYMALGKGRDMGFDSINAFESKVAGGNGEQCLSRDVNRLGTRFDFLRLMAWCGPCTEPWYSMHCLRMLH